MREQQGWTAAQLANRQNYPNLFKRLSEVTTNVPDWNSPGLEGAGPEGQSDGDPSLVDGSLVLDSPPKPLDRIEVESEDESESPYFTNSNPATRFLGWL